MIVHLICNSDSDDASFIECGGGNVGLVSLRNPYGKGINDDSIGVIDLNRGRTLLMVADGAGGTPKGDEASSMVLNDIEKSIKRSLRDRRSVQLRNILLDTIELVNKKLIERGEGGKTTLLACEIEKNRMRAYQVGDCELFVCGQKGREKYHTVSHSPTGFGVEAGFINPAEAMDHPERHLLFNIVGDEEMKIEIGPWVELSPNDTIFLGSDGVFDNVMTDELIEIVRSGPLEEKTDFLKEMLQSMGEESPGEFSFDDISFIIYRNN